MSNRLRIKNLQRHLYYEQRKREQQSKEIAMLASLARREFFEIGASTNFTPMDTMFASVEYYDHVMNKMLHALAEEWIKQIKPTIQRQLQLYSLERVVDIVRISVVMPKPNDRNVRVITRPARWGAV